MPNEPAATSNRHQRSFREYAAAGYGPHLLPIVPPGATISPASKLDGTKLGKAPARWTPSGYVGLGGWPTFEATAHDIQQWDRQVATVKFGPSVALQGRAFPAVDVDVDDPVLAADLKVFVIEQLGVAPTRHTTSPLDNLPGARHAIFYRSGDPLPSWEIAFTSPSGEKHMIEFKARGRQMVVDGPHRKGGVYTYPDGPDLIDWGGENLTAVTADQVDALRCELLGFLAGLGCTVISNKGRSRAINAQDARPLPAPSLADVRAALAAAPNGEDVDRDEWVNVAHYIKGSCLGLEEDGFDLFAEWCEEDNPLENIEALWRSLPDAPRVGWGQLASWAARRSNGAFKVALPEFANDNEGKAALREEAVCEMFETQIWVENQERVFDTRDHRLRNRQQFNAHFAAIGKPTVRGKCAWDVFINEPDRPTPLLPTSRRQSVFEQTFIPGASAIVNDGGERRVNAWKKPEGIPAAASVRDDEVRVWLDHVALVVPDPVQREQLLNWMASVVQRQSEKPNHGVVIGGKHGIGKSMLIEPLRLAIGRQNVEEIHATDLDSNFNGWLGKAKLFVVEEMMNFKKREVMQRLKSYLAAPPDRLPINPKYGKIFTIPNLVAGIFFTNHEDAIAIEPGERRFFVIWSEAAKQPPAYFEKLAKWYREGGAALAARWLELRDYGDYNMLGEAPITVARDNMRRATRSKLEEVVENAIEEGRWPCSADLVAVDDVRAAISHMDFGPSGAPGAERVSRALRDAGARPAHPHDRRPALGARPEGLTCPEPNCAKKQARLVSLRHHERYEGLSNAELVAEFWRLREAAWTDYKAEQES